MADWPASVRSRNLCLVGALFGAVLAPVECTSDVEADFFIRLFLLWAAGCGAVCSQPPRVLAVARVPPAQSPRSQVADNLADFLLFKEDKL